MTAESVIAPTSRGNRNYSFRVQKTSPHSTLGMKNSADIHIRNPKLYFHKLHGICEPDASGRFWKRGYRLGSRIVTTIDIEVIPWDAEDGVAEGDHGKVIWRSKYPHGQANTGACRSEKLPICRSRTFLPTKSRMRLWAGSAVPVRPLSRKWCAARAAPLKTVDTAS
jgi:hypothetical protein